MDALAVDYFDERQLPRLFLDDDGGERVAGKRKSERKGKEKFEAHRLAVCTDTAVVVVPNLSRQYFLRTAIKFLPREKSLRIRKIVKRTRGSAHEAK
jgi:hypothetical protein